MSKLLDTLHKNTFEAIRKQNFNIASALIKTGCNLNYQDPENNNLTFLMYALLCNPFHYITGFVPSVVSYITKKDFNLDLQTKTGDTVLMIALSQRILGIAHTLIKKGCKLDIKNNFGETALMIAVYNTDDKYSFEVIKLLIESGCNLKFRNKVGRDALCLARSNLKHGGEEALKIFNLLKNKLKTK